MNGGLIANLPLIFGILGGIVVALQTAINVSQRIKAARAHEKTQAKRIGQASKALREQAFEALGLKRDQRAMRREMERMRVAIEEAEALAERERLLESQIYVFDERKNIGDQAFIVPISHADFTALSKGAPNEITASWQHGRRYMVWAANEKMASAKSIMRFNADKGYRVGAPTLFQGDPEAY
jgi:hypothetical protein